MWEEEVCIYGTSRLYNNFPTNWCGNKRDYYHINNIINKLKKPNLLPNLLQNIEKLM